ncbi:MFS transporter [Candidatus Bathyarchaeota archaeon]|nr:MFS transporter [Candidatus Bathyarchaeota archaeon]
MSRGDHTFIGSAARYAAALSTMFIGYGLTQPLLSLYTSEFVGTSYLLVGALISTIGLVKAATGPVSGFLSDRYGRKRMSAIGAASMAASLLAVTLARTSTHIAAAFILYGLGQAFFFLALMTAMVEAAGPGRRAMALGLYEGVNGLSILVGTYLSGRLMDTLGVRSIFMLATVFSFASAAICAFLLEETMTSNADTRLLDLGGLRGILSREYLVAMAGGFLFMYSLNLYTTVMPLYTTLTIQIPQSFLTTLFIAMSGSTAVASLAAGPVSDRVGRKLPLAAGLAVTALSYALLLIFKTQTMLVVSTLTLGLGAGFFHPVASAIVADISTEETRGKAFGFYRLTRDLGTFAGPAVSGVIINALGVGALFKLNIGLTVAAALLALLAIKETLRKG